MPFPTTTSLRRERLDCIEADPLLTTRHTLDIDRRMMRIEVKDHMSEALLEPAFGQRP
jgi:hypothetical protein